MRSGKIEVNFERQKCLRTESHQVCNYHLRFFAIALRYWRTKRANRTCAKRYLILISVSCSKQTRWSLSLPFLRFSIPFFKAHALKIWQTVFFWCKGNAEAFVITISCPEENGCGKTRCLFCIPVLTLSPLASGSS